MKVRINVKDKTEAQAVEIGMADPAVRAFVIICGLLEQLPTDRARARVLRYAQDMATDPQFGKGTNGNAEAEASLPFAEVGGGRLE